MNAVALLFSSSGRLAPRPFTIAVALVYLASFLSQALLSPAVTSEAGLWPFALLQTTLIWAWIVLHWKRLRDAGRSCGLAIGIACLYFLGLVLLLLVLVMITASEGSSELAQSGQGLFRLLIVLYLLGALIGSSEFGVLGFWLMGLVGLLLLPLAIGLGFSIWAGTRPSVPAAP